MDLGHIHCLGPLIFRRDRDYHARGNDLMSLVHDHIWQWDLTCRWSNARTNLHWNNRKLTLDDPNKLLPLVSFISKTELHLGLIKLKIVALSLLIDFLFLIFSLSLHFSLMQDGINEFNELMNTLVLAGIGLTLFCVVDWVRYTYSLTSLLYFQR